MSFSLCVKATSINPFDGICANLLRAFENYQLTQMQTSFASSLPIKILMLEAMMIDGPGLSYNCSLKEKDELKCLKKRTISSMQIKSILCKIS